MLNNNNNDNTDEPGTRELDKKTHISETNGKQTTETPTLIIATMQLSHV